MYKSRPVSKWSVSLFVYVVFALLVKSTSFNFPRLLPWRVRTMLVCFYGSYCERHLVEQNMFTLKSKTTERKCEMATVHVL